MKKIAKYLTAFFFFFFFICASVLVVLCSAPSVVSIEETGWRGTDGSCRKRGRIFPMRSFSKNI